MADQRYIRQTTLPDFGIEGQQAMAHAKVLVIGVGGLGCPLLQYLVTMGIGELGLVDGDTVSLSNLPRQILFTPSDLGQYKVDVAKAALAKLNKDVKIENYPFYIDQITCTEIFPLYDVIVDCSDNFATRYMVNDACILHQKPLAFAAVNKYEGQIALFNIASEEGYTTNYRDLFPNIPEANEVQNCNDAGILGVVPGLIGLLQATEVIKYICNLGQLLTNKVLYYNILTHQSMIIEYKHNKSSKDNMPKSTSDFLSMSYHSSCEDLDVEEISAMEFSKLNFNEVSIVDVRGAQELPKWTVTDYIAIELKDLPYRLHDIPKGKVIFVCQAGIRSVEAAKIAGQYFNDSSRFSSLKGGIFKLGEIMNFQL
jgi:sulfur-carrier protein adenylyltransferase/sulfurtransferase